MAVYDPEMDAKVTQESIIEQLKKEESAIASLPEDTILRLKDVYKNSIRLLKVHEAREARRRYGVFPFNDRS